MAISAAFPGMQPQQPQQRPQNLAGQMFGQNVGSYVGGLGANPLFMGGLTTLMGQGAGTGAQIAQATQQGRMQQSEFERQQQQRQRMQEVWGRVFQDGQPSPDHPLTKGMSPQLLSLAQAMGPEEGLNFLGRAALQGPQKQPAAIQEYQFDMQQRQAAGQPVVPFGQWSQQRKQPLVQMVGESEYQKSRGKALAETYGTLQTEGSEAVERIGQLRQIDALLSDPSVYTGTGAGSIQALKRAGKTLLGLDFEGVGSADAARRISTEMALSLRKNLPGPLSNADRDFLMNIPPNIGDSAEGRKLLVELMVAREQRRVDVANLARQYRQQYGRLDEGWHDVLAQYNEENPIVQPEMVERARAAASATPQPSPAAGVAKRIGSDEEYDALPSGTLFIGPDGQLRRKP